MLSVGDSFVGEFPLPGGILVFPASTHSFFMVGLLRAMSVSAEPSLILTLPGFCGLSSLRDEVRALLISWTHSWLLGTLPWVVPVVSAPSEMRCMPSPVDVHPAPGGACSLSSLRDEVHTVLQPVVGYRGDWSCCCGRIPQSAPEGLFLFGKNPPA